MDCECPQRQRDGGVVNRKFEVEVSRFFDENRAQAGHGRRAAISGVNSMVFRVVNAVFQIGSVIFLARLLSPEDYGLVGMVLAVTGFAPLLVDLGSRDAIVRQTTITESEVSTLFWITIGTGLLLTGVVASSSHFIAGFYHDERLASITVISALAFVATALSCQHQALMRRALMFKQLVAVEVSAGIGSGLLAIAMAFAGWEYWALVIRPIALSVLITVGAWWYCPWMPSRPAFQPTIRRMIKFGLALIGGSLTEFVRGSIERVAIGRRYGPEGLGQYQNGEQMFSQVMILLTYLQDVAIGNLSKVLRDPAEFRRLWAKGLSTMTFFAMPVFGALAVVGENLARLLLGSKWATAGLILSILALRGIPQVIDRTLGWLHVPAGHADRWMRWNVFATVAQIGAMLIGLPFGTTGVAIASVIVSYLLVLPGLAYAGRPLSIGVSDIVRVVGPQFVSAIAAFGVAILSRQWFASFSSDVVTILGLLTVYAATYLLIVVSVFRLTSPIWVMWSVCAETFFGRVRSTSRLRVSHDVPSSEREEVVSQSFSPGP